MTDTWSHTAERAIAPEPEAAPVPAPVPALAPALDPAPAAVEPSWRPYAEPALHAEPALPASEPEHADPLILELWHAAKVEAPPHIEATPSVYGRVEPDLEPMELTPQEVAPPAPASVPAPITQASETPVAASPITAPPLAAQPLAESLIAQVEKPVEIAHQPAEPFPAPAPAVVEPLPAVVAVAAPLLSAEPPPTARLVMTESPIMHAANPHSGIDPVLAGFDHIVALAGYVLLFLSVFMFGVPALATVALAYAHKNDSHMLVRSHYRFQLRIFWTAILFGVLALGATITAGGLAVSKLVDFIHAHLPGVDGVMDRANVGAWSGEIAGVLLVAGVTLALLAVVWTLVASVFGFLRLLGNRPIGHQFVGS